MSSNNAVLALDLDQLAQRCAEETERFFRGESHQEIHCFELFRRAIVERQETAWSLVYHQYRPLVTGWIQQHELFARSREDAQYFMGDAFTRFWRACTAQKFERLGQLRQLLAYLKACVHSSLADHARKHRAVQEEEFSLTDNATGQTSTSVHHTVIAREWQETFWRLLHDKLTNEKELVVVEHCFILDHKPRDICELRPDLFPDRQEIYRVKDNLLRRLRRDPDLSAYFEADA